MLFRSVQFEDVSKYYQTGSVRIAAADHLNFYVDKGEFCIIVGPSGAGKTTLTSTTMKAADFLTVLPIPA